MSAIVVNGIHCDTRFALYAVGLAVVQVLFEPRVIRARDLHLDPVALIEDNARRPQIDSESIDMTLVEKCFVIKPVSESRACRGIQDEPFGSIGINVNQLSHPVGVWCIRLSPQFDRDAASNFDRLVEYRCLIPQDILSIAKGSLVHGSLLQEEIAAPDSGNGVSRIIAVRVLAFRTVWNLPSQSPARREEIRSDSRRRRPR